MSTNLCSMVLKETVAYYIQNQNHVYVDDLLLILSKAGVGCFIGLHFVGALAYANDLALLAPTAYVMSKLLAICEDYARKYSISFNALKSKCLVALPKNCCSTFKKVNDCTFYIDGRMIDLVQSFFSSWPSDHIRFG